MIKINNNNINNNSQSTSIHFYMKSDNNENGANL